MSLLPLRVIRRDCAMDMRRNSEGEKRWKKADFTNAIEK